MLTNKGGSSLVQEIKNSQLELRDRDDQIKLLNDMLNSAAYQNRMKGNFLNILASILKFSILTYHKFVNF